MVKKSVSIYLNEGQFERLHDYLTNLKQMMKDMGSEEDFPHELQAVLGKLEKHL